MKEPVKYNKTIFKFISDYETDLSFHLQHTPVCKSVYLSMKLSSSILNSKENVVNVTSERAAFWLSFVMSNCIVVTF